jgi:hypothetical protein
MYNKFCCLIRTLGEVFLSPVRVYVRLLRDIFEFRRCGVRIGETKMSQAKVEKYKHEKANRRKTMARAKTGRLLGRICAVVILLGIAGWAGYAGYQHYEDTRPVETFYTDVSALTDYLSGLDAEE